MADSPNDDAWRVHGSRPVYDSKWLTVRLTEVELPSGQHFEHHTVRMPTAAVAVVLDATGDHVLLTWRHRFVSNVWNYELPGGLVEEGETPAQTARREILEETGYDVDDLTHLVTFEPMIGMVTSPHHVFLATGVRRVQEPAERDEGRFAWVALADIPTHIERGKILNSGTLVGLLHVLAARGRKDGA